MKNSKKKTKKKQSVWTFILIVALIGAIICVGAVVLHLLRANQAQQAYDDLTEVVYTEEEIASAAYDERDGDAPELPEDIWTEKVDNPIDFDKLAAINPDLYAWIRVEDTQIDYPIAQHKDNADFYLHHNLYGEAQYSGCIYSQYINAKDFSDPHTVLYGHNMINGAMFQNLHKFEDPEFFEKHPEFYVYMPGHRLTYRIFASYPFDNRNLLTFIDTKDPVLFEGYLKDIMSTYSLGGNVRDDVKLEKDSKILTLSTCVGGNSDRRYLVQAVLVKDDLT